MLLDKVRHVLCAVWALHGGGTLVDVDLFLIIDAITVFSFFVLPVFAVTPLLWVWRMFVPKFLHIKIVIVDAY
jgi:hypothetical protein